MFGFNHGEGLFRTLLVQQQQHEEKLKSTRLTPVRCLDGSKAWAEGAVRLDFLRKEKNATRNKHQRAACVGMDKSSTVLMCRSKSTVIGCFWWDFVPMMRLSPFLVRATGKLFNTSHAKPCCKWRRQTELRWFITYWYEAVLHDRYARKHEMVEAEAEGVWGWNDGRT